MIQVNPQKFIIFIKKIVNVTNVQTVQNFILLMMILVYLIKNYAMDVEEYLPMSFKIILLMKKKKKLSQILMKY